MATTKEPRYSVAFPKRYWYPACRSEDLGRAPLGFTLMETPLVAFRDGDGVAHTLIDRCPHRNVPLSLGRVHEDGCLECDYHGWRFSGDGKCQAVPGLFDADKAPSRTRNVTTHATRESDGFIWIWGEAGVRPRTQPFALPQLARPAGNGARAQSSLGAGEVVLKYDIEGTVHAAVENALDVPHTAFLHKGLHRGGTEQNEITATRKAIPNGLEVEYIGEPVGMGPIRMSPDGENAVTHFDRFFLPSIAQVEYRAPNWFHIVNTILHLPLSPLKTRCWFVVRYWTPLPEFVLRPIVWAQGRQIAQQDVEILGEQTKNATRFGGERYTSTDLDLLGPAIFQLMRQAEKAEGIGAAGNGKARKPVRSRISKKTVAFRA